MVLLLLVVGCGPNEESFNKLLKDCKGELNQYPVKKGDEVWSVLCSNKGKISCISNINNGNKEFCLEQDFKNIADQTMSAFDVPISATENVYSIVDSMKKGEPVECEKFKDGQLNKECLDIKNNLEKTDKSILNQAGEEYFDVENLYVNEHQVFIAACSAKIEGTYISWQPEFPLKSKGTAKIFRCSGVSRDEYINYIWVPSDKWEDKDKDKVPKEFDCDDNDKNVFGDFTMYSGPNPRAICGDGKKNTCGIFEEPDDDDCDLDKDGCENRCLDDGRSCSWKESSGNNKCCGDDGIEDLGSINKADDGDFLCLNLDDELVGFEGNEKIPGWNCEKNDWCWVSSINDAKFKVISVQKELDKPKVDFVSNGDQWFECSTEGKLDTPRPIRESDKTREELLNSANRFYCYQEGNRWSWAECVPEGKKPKGQSNDDKSVKTRTLKQRFKGEGLYTLPIINGGNIVDQAQGIEIISSSKPYSNVYKGENYDFTGYKYLNFMIKYANEKLKLPTGINVKIYGNKNKELFSQSVLGNTINSPFFGENWMHIRIEVPEFKDVERVVISRETEGNIIIVKNIYLSNDGDIPLCSGQDSQTESSWLADIDQGSKGKVINGKDLCEELYQGAWLGMDDVVSKDTSNCCGNDPNEYYAGKSENNKGCWNSQVVDSNTAISNVDYDVEFKDKKYEIKSQDIFKVNVKIKNSFELSYICPNIKSCNDLSSESDRNNCRRGLDFKSECRENTNKISCNVKWDSQAGITTTRRILCDNVPLYNFEDIEIQIKNNNPVLVTTLNLDRNVFLNKDGKIFTESTNDNVEVYFIDKNIPQLKLNSIKSSDFYLDKQIFYVVAKPKENFFDDLRINVNEISVKNEFSYPCSKNECLFPMPGVPPYKITNKNPNLYDLYYVYYDDNGKEIETLITQKNQEFSKKGMIRAKKVSKQVLFFNDGEESGFFGCQPAKYLQETATLNNFNLQKSNFCTAKGNYFCSFGGFGSVSQWSSEFVEEVGYDFKDENYKDQVTKDATEFFKNLVNELKLKSLLKDKKEINSKTDENTKETENTKEDNFDPAKAIPPKYRTQVSIAIPGRNILSDPEFKAVDGTNFKHWEIFQGVELISKQISSYNQKEERIDLLTGQELRSQRIPVNATMKLSFTYVGTAKFSIYQYDVAGNQIKFEINKKDQEFEIVGLGNNPTQKGGFIQIVFRGPGFVKKPMLQVVDDKKSSYNFVNEKYQARSPVACCPKDYCWNGYACVEPMGKSTLLAEYSSDKLYRCIEGKWSALPIQYDWNKNKWGFCQTKDQCFVLSTVDGGIEGKKADDFYIGEYPNCINSGEYIYDNYCKGNGEWTSRTSMLASQLLEIAKNNEYVLYCTNPSAALVDLGINKQYVTGNKQTISATDKKISNENKKGLGEKETETKQNVEVCYTLAKDGKVTQSVKDLVPDEINTCINNVCVLKYKQGNDFKVAFATSLNKPITDANSFLLSLGVGQNSLNDVCKPTGTETEIKCDLSALSPSGQSLYHVSNINSIIYAKDGISLEPGFAQKVVDTVKNWFKNLLNLQTKLTPEKKFIEGPQFREVYLLDAENKKVRAMNEIRPGDQTLILEYENFKTPICKFIENKKAPADLKVPLLGKATGQQKLVCTTNGNIQRIEAVGGTSIWAELTGQLRVK